MNLVMPADGETGASVTSRTQAGRGKVQSLAELETANLRCDVVKLRGCLCTYGGNRGQAHDDDQSEHHGVLDGRRAVFGLQKMSDF